MTISQYKEFKMGNEVVKEKHSKRIQQKLNHMMKQIMIRASVFKMGKTDQEDKSVKHRYHKMNGVRCGNPDCSMCGNPRRFFNERTIQEKSSMQSRLWE